MKYQVSSDNIPFLSVKQRLKSLGASPYVLSKPEVGKLALLLHEDEVVEAFIYGVHAAGWGMLAATNRKLIFVDKTFLDLTVEETPYSMITEIDHRFGHIAARLTVRTRSKDYSFKRVSRVCARNFVDYVEDRLVEVQMREIEREKTAEAERILQQSMNYHLPSSDIERWVSN